MNIKTSARSIFAASIALAAHVIIPAGAFAQTFAVGADPRLHAADGRIAVDAFDDDAGELTPGVRHFAWQFGEIPEAPFALGDPGFNAPANSGLPVGSQLRFDGVRHLAVWNGGNGPVRFGRVTDGTTIRISLGSASSTLSGTADAVSGFGFVNVSSSGALHRHLTSTISRPNGATLSPGLYMAAIRLAVSGGSLGRSDALYIAYNLGLDSQTFTRGMNYLAAPLGGDSDFDHDVDFDDLLTLARNYGSNNDASWFDGDFNSDRAVNFDDLLALARSYGQNGNATSAATLTAATSASFAADWALAQSLVPEPTVAVAGLWLVTLVGGRRRVAQR